MKWECSTARLRLQPCDRHSATLVAGFFALPAVSAAYFIGQVAHHPASWFAAADDDWPRAALVRVCAHSPGHGVAGWVQLAGDQLSYVVNPACWGQGLGLEMVRAFCAHYPAQLGVASLRAEVLRENVASRRLLERLGFRFVGLASRACHGRPGSATMLQYAYALPWRTDRLPVAAAAGGTALSSNTGR